MKAVVVSSPRHMELQDVPTPSGGPDRAVVRVRCATICSSDILLVDGDSHDTRFPLIPGHEWSGVVESAPGSYRSLVGCKVVAETLQPCGRCPQCRRGRPNLCMDLKEIGQTLPGAFAEYIEVDPRSLIPIPENISFQEAALVEPLAVALNAVSRVSVTPGSRVLVLGSGLIGLMITALLEHALDVIVIDCLPERLQRASSVGASRTLCCHTDNLSTVLAENGIPAPDIVFDATGYSGSFRSAVEVVSPGGQIGYVGYSGSRTVCFQPSMIMLKNLSIKGVLSPTHTWSQAVEIIARKKDVFGTLVTHEFPLGEFAQAFDLMRHRRDSVIRAALIP